MRKKVILLGSTGSVGMQAVEILKENPDSFQVVALAAGGSREELLEQQVKYFPGAKKIIGNAEESLKNNNLADYIFNTEADVVLNAIDGFNGLIPSMAVLESGKKLALANKETMIFGGELIKEYVNSEKIIPVDSEHSAIFQCLKSGKKAEINRLILTASGGPFRGFTKEKLLNVTVQEALAHPTWSMGKNISLNSATLVNKGLEVIEAHYLFQIDYDQIATVVQPQSLVHSMVDFVDGSTIMQFSTPSMRLPIGYALNYPDRLPNCVESIDFSNKLAIQFEPLNSDVFPAVHLAKTAGKKGGLLPTIFNASNEELAKAFFAGKIKFVDIVAMIEQILAKATAYERHPESIEDILATVHWARIATNQLVESAQR